jgi:hypothetical protein
MCRDEQFVASLSSCLEYKPEIQNMHKNFVEIRKESDMYDYLSSCAFRFQLRSPQFSRFDIAIINIFPYK